jgi:hypothetical protein
MEDRTIELMLPVVSPSNFQSRKSTYIMEFGIGSLDIRIYPTFTPEFDALVNSNGGTNHNKQQYYSGMITEPFGLPATVHVQHEITGHSKVQFLDVPSRTLLECIEVVSRLCEADPFSLPVVRLHLGCDVPDVPVSWFRNSMRVKYRQNSEVFGRITNESFKNGVQTLYFGAKNNGVTVYDKSAERRNDYRSRKLKAGRSGLDGDLPSFESLYGFSDDSVITRIERKYANGKIPPELSTVGRLIANARQFDPFTNICLCQQANKKPDLEIVGMRLYRKAVTWMAEVEEYGLGEAYKRLSKYTHGNAKREFEQINAWLDVHTEPPVTHERLLALYQEGIDRQLRVVE